ncbi:hypothetical protein, partial [Streptomyces axinellae]|uniref:hypothetical protein n=1 Tax=Streptomyces axinellae TaxID=552788 RepID=UPI003CD056EB
MPRLSKDSYVDFAKAFRAYYENNPQSRGMIPARGAVERGVKIGVRASNLHSLKNNAAVSREEEKVLKEYNVALTKKDGRLKISSSVKVARTAKSTEADLKYAANVRELYAQDGQPYGTLPAWTSSKGQRVNQLARIGGECTAGPEEARALEQDAGLPLTQTETGRYRIDGAVLAGRKPRSHHFGEHASVASSGPPLNASQDQQFLPQYQAPDASQGWDQSEYALQMFQQEWSQPHRAPGGGAGSDVVYGSGAYGSGAVLPSVGDVSMAGVWDPQVDMSSVAVGDPAFGSGPGPNPG